MTGEDRGVAPRHLDALFRVGTLGGLTDAQLLERFTFRRGDAAEPAFAVLVERHGPMVLRACRAMLRDSHEADDAFQATFLILARKADSLWVRDSLGPWLHQVALRASSHLLRAAARRRRHERLAAESAARTAERPDVEELGALLREEVGRLPERYRAAVVLCLLEGLTPEQAALQLNCPAGTVHSRLARGRERLRDRLRRRGLAPPPEQKPADLQSRASRTAVPASLLTSTVGAATRYAAAGGAAGAVSAPVAFLMEGVLMTMLWTRLKLAAALLLAVVVIGAGVQAGRSRPDDRPRSEKPRELPARAEEKDEDATKESLIDGLLARSTKITSGRFEYHLKVEDAGRVTYNTDYLFRFSGDDWTRTSRNSQPQRAVANHDGRLLTFTETVLVGDKSVRRELTIGFPESPFGNPPYPPVRAGTLWNASTARFVRERASKARLLGPEDVDGVETRVLEWDVDPEDKYLAFESITDLLRDGGKLRLYVARQLGHALARIEHVDRFGTVQDLYEYSKFQEVAPGVHVPTICRLGVGSFKQDYRLTKIENINQPIPNDEFILSIPEGTSVHDERPKSKDDVDKEGKRTYSLKEYPFRNFQGSAPYPHGFPPELLKELDRDVVKPPDR